MPVPCERRRQLVAAIPGFDLLPEPALAALADALTEEHFAPGAAVVVEGTTGDRLYVIDAGDAEVSAAGIDGPVPLGVLHDGESFGELALLAADGLRVATVEARTPLTALSLPASEFETVLQAYPSARATVEEVREELLIATFLKIATPFGSLNRPSVRRLARQVTRLQVDAGEAIVREGELGDACFVVLAGSAEVVRALDDGAEKRVSTLRAGALFGEAALLTTAPRNATVRALELCTLLVVHRSDLLSAMDDDRDVARGVFDLLRLRDRPRQNPNVVVVHQVGADGETVAILKEPTRGTYLRLSSVGWFIWQRLDGRRTLRDLVLDYLERSGSLAPGQIAALVARLGGMGFLHLRDLRPDVSALAVGDQSAGPVSWLARAYHVLHWRLALHDADGLATRVYERGGRWLFTPAGLAAIATVVLVGLGALVLGLPHIVRMFDPTMAGGLPLLLLVPLRFVSVVLHESGHALTVKRFGRSVGVAGVGWRWFGPFAFVDTSDMWLSPRGPRIAVGLAGSCADLVVGGIAACAALAASNPAVATILWQVALLSYASVLFNLNPLLEFDGYFVLSDLVQRPNLRQRALEWLGHRFLPTLRSEGLPGLHRHRLETVYAIASLAYMAIAAWLTIAVYRLLIEGWLSRAVSDVAAVVVGWMLAGVLGFIAAASVVAELRRRPQITPVEA